MKVCVTGNLGFIGKALTKELIDKGFYVIGFDKPDISSLSDLRTEIFNYFNDNMPEAVFHVGASSDTMNTDTTEMMMLNAESTFIISDWCDYHDVPIIYSSSASCYGIGCGPNTLYGWSKYLGERYVLRNHGIALRYYNVYGYDESHKGRMASMAYQAYVKQQNEQQVMLFCMKPKRDFVYIKDVVSANIHALENYQTLCDRRYDDRRYDVGFGEARYFEDMMDIMDIKYTIDEYPRNLPKGYQFYTKADKSKFMPGWNPKWNLEDGLTDYKKYLD